MRDAELSDDQIAILKTVHDEFESAVRWPIWQFIDLQIKPQGAAMQALTAMPTIRDTRQQFGTVYGLVTWENRVNSPVASTPMQLTVAGLHRLGFDVLPELYVRLVRYLADEQANLIPSATEVVERVITQAELHEALFGFPPEKTRSLADMRMEQLRMMLRREPPTMYMRVDVDAGESWTLTVPAEIEAYADIGTVDDYLDRVAQQTEPPAAPFARSGDSPYPIPDAVSYLDAVWTARFGVPLFNAIDPKSAVSLVYVAATPDEFDGRCSALADVLSRLQVPPDDGLQRKNVRPVVLLGRWFARYFSDEPEVAMRLDAATSVLSTIVNIRVGAQHSADRRKAATAFQVFGLDYPPNDWGSAWAVLQQSASNALDAIRQEIAVLSLYQPSSSAGS
jgi:hypothetical protein